MELSENGLQFPDVHHDAELLLVVTCLFHYSSLLCALAEVAINLTLISPRLYLVAEMFIRSSTVTVASFFSAKV